MKLSKTIKATCLTAGALVLTGCINTQVSESMTPIASVIDGKVRMLHESDNNGWNDAEVGEQRKLNYSPWGVRSTQVTLISEYFSASGRKCFNTMLNHEGQSKDPLPTAAVLCQYQSDGSSWGFSTTAQGHGLRGASK